MLPTSIATTEVLISIYLIPSNLFMTCVFPTPLRARGCGLWSLAIEGGVFFKMEVAPWGTGYSTSLSYLNHFQKLPVYWQKYSAWNMFSISAELNMSISLVFEYHPARFFPGECRNTKIVQKKWRRHDIPKKIDHPGCDSGYICYTRWHHMTSISTKLAIFKV